MLRFKRIFFLILFSSALYNSAAATDISNLNYEGDYTVLSGLIEINLEPFESLQNSYVFINDCNPEKITRKNQKIEYLKLPGLDYIKIDVVAPAGSSYKSKIFYLRPDTIRTTLALRKKITPEISAYFNTLSKTIIQITEYSKNSDSALRAKIDANLKILFNIDNINYLDKNLRALDYSDYLSLVEQINLTVLEEIEDEYYKLLAQILLNLIPKINDSVNDYLTIRSFKKFTKTENIENIIKSKNKNILMNLISSAPLLKNIYEWFKYY